MGTRSGKYGQIDVGASTYGTFNHWTMSEVADAEQFGTFGGGGRKSGNVGQGSATGVIEGPHNFAALSSLVDIGDSVTLKLYTSTTGGGGEQYITVPAQITSRDFDVDGNTGAKVGMSLGWQSNGTWTETG